MTPRIAPAGSQRGYAMVILLAVVALTAALLTANWATIRSLHRECLLLDRQHAIRWTNSPALPRSTNTIANPPSGR